MQKKAYKQFSKINYISDFKLGIHIFRLHIVIIFRILNQIQFSKHDPIKIALKSTESHKLNKRASKTVLFSLGYHITC